MNIQDVTKWLVENRYIAMNIKGRYEFLKSFHEALKFSIKPTILAVQKENSNVTISDNTIPDPLQYKVYNYSHWCHFYNQFILACHVPGKITSGHSTYAGNKFSEEGMKAFQKALKDGFEYKGLVMAVTLYYKSSLNYKKAIGRYMSDGEWRTDYAALVSKAQEGNLEKHINETINDGPGTHFTWG